MTFEAAEKRWKTNAQTNDNSNYYSSLYFDAKFNIQYPILDIGGGNGAFLKYLNIEEADILDLAGNTSLMGSYNFIEADLTKKLPNINKKYKTIFIMETLEHIKNPLYLLANTMEYLDDNGNIYIAVPYTPLFAPDKDGDMLNVHLWRWTDKELEDQCQRLGYKTEWIVKRRRFKNSAFWLPHCFLILKLTKNG
jgi:hypothetical protein